LSLKLFQLQRLGKKIKIQAISRLDLPKGLIEGGVIKNQPEVLAAIKQLIAKPKFGRVSQTEIVACLPETKTFIKLIEVEKTPNDFEATLRAEMEKQIPFSFEEIYYDWQIISETSSARQVLVAAGSKEIVNQYADLINKTGIPLSALEVESVPICRSLLAEEHIKFKAPSKTTYGIIDIGAQRTSMTIYSEKTLLFTMSIPLSGDKITEQIAKILKLDFKLAEKAKIICGLDEHKAQGIVRDILSDMINELINKIKGVIRYYQDHFPGHGPLNKILLCGGGANIENISQILSQALSIEVAPGDPLTNLNESREKLLPTMIETHQIAHEELATPDKKTLSVTQDTSLIYTTAIGLALRGIFIEDV
jgi:type IV pilus assembly protein PilM